MKCTLLPILGSLCITLVDVAAQAQSITAAPDGTGTIVTPVGSRTDIQGGTQAGTNLFHSFAQFNVGQNQSANFLVNANIQNILSRVVGGSPSFINGLIQVMGSRANLYLMNPAGIVFGVNAELNVPSSFTATTANAIGFGCGSLRCEGLFPATGTVSFPQLAAHPSSFAFLANQSGVIFNAGSLSVLPGQSLTLLGGRVINIGSLSAPGGTISVVETSGERLMRIREPGQVLSLELPLETRNSLTANSQPFTPIALPQLLTGGHLSDATGVTVENGVIKLTRAKTTLSAQVSVVEQGKAGQTVNRYNRMTANRLAEKGGLYNSRVLPLNNSNMASRSTILLGNLVQAAQVIPTQPQSAVDRSTTTSSLSVPVLNVKSQPTGELAVAAVDGEFTHAYQQYLGLGKANSVQLEQVQATLVQVKQKRGINSALIYASFVPNTDKPTVGDSDSPQPDDQLQLILIHSLGKPIVRRVPVTRREVVSQAKLFRLSVADPDDSHSFIPLAHQLHNWLLTPLEADLQAAQITNLVFCLDEGLRTIPIAALMHQNRFLIEQYSVSVIPSAALTNLDGSRPDTSKILAMGADHFAGKEPLPAVPLELQAIRARVANSTIALNEKFTLDNLLRSQQQDHPEILHLATHAEFNPGSPSRSYIQLWNTKLTLGQVKGLNWKGMNLTLLTLSACITAISSPEAEMGFAGLASVSGVRSTLGSLWMVSDVGTLALMSEFYGQLKTSDTIVGALQKAQLSLLKGTARLDAATVRSLQEKRLLPSTLSLSQASQFSHPFYWSAFTLVGNPW